MLPKPASESRAAPDEGQKAAKARLALALAALGCTGPRVPVRVSSHRKSYGYRGLAGQMAALELTASDGLRGIGYMPRNERFQEREELRFAAFEE